MTKRSRLTEDEKVYIHEAYLLGDSCKAIALALGRSAQAVQDCLETFGFTLTVSHRKQQRILQVRELVKRGLTTGAIASRLGVSARTVFRDLRYLRTQGDPPQTATLLLSRGLDGVLTLSAGRADHPAGALTVVEQADTRATLAHLGLGVFPGETHRITLRMVRLAPPDATPPCNSVGA